MIPDIPEIEQWLKTHDVVRTHTYVVHQQLKEEDLVYLGEAIAFYLERDDVANLSFIINEIEYEEAVAWDCNRGYTLIILYATNDTHSAMERIINKSLNTRRITFDYMGYKESGLDV